MDKPPKTAPGLVDHGVSVLNAWLGSYLEQRGNGLAEPLAFVVAGRATDPEALPAPENGRVCVLVHGLMCNEGIFTFEGADGVSTDYGRALEQAIGYLPLYIRYNTGAAIHDNGARLASLLERYVTHNVGSIASLVLIGHSMGGLLLRSACDHGVSSQQHWPAYVRHVFYLGSPHRGAPLEQFTHLASQVLGHFDTTATRVVRDVLNSRSDGIKDLRTGNLHKRADTVAGSEAGLDLLPIPPWLPHAKHHCILGQAFVAASFLGDGVVWPGSASAGAGSGRPPQESPAVSMDVRALPGLNHLALARNPAVLAQIEQCLKEEDHG